MRVGVIGLLHESNTFINRMTTLTHFEQDTLLTGAAVEDRFRGTGHELGGFFGGLGEEGVEAVPIFAARAVPYGPITTDTFQQLVRMMQTEVAAAGPLDGILVAPHGATVCESIGDADGHWLSELRQQVGDTMPVIGTLDAHANLSQQMVDVTDALIAYRTNPHLDQFDRGRDAAQLIARTIRGEVSPVQQAAFPALAINIERQKTSEPHLVELYQAADQICQQPGVLSTSILLGFPYADVAEMGSSILVVSDGDRAMALHSAEALSQQLWSRRDQMAGQFISIDAALKQASGQSGPVCLLDMGDNVGGGSPGDSTHLVHAFACHGVASALVCLCDPQSVQQAVDAGVEATVELQIGGKTDDNHGTPWQASFVVQGIYEGRFRDTQTRHGGFTEFDQGRCAVVRSADGRLTALLTSLRVPPFSLVQLTSCNIEPADYQVIVAKGVNAPVAAYEPVCQNLIRVNTPGCTTADMRQLTFQHRRQPMFPFEVADSNYE